MIEQIETLDTPHIHANYVEDQNIQNDIVDLYEKVNELIRAFNSLAAHPFFASITEKKE